MEREQRQVNLVGYYLFNSKDNERTYYIAQVLFNKVNVDKQINKAILVNVFTDSETYKKLLNTNIGDLVTLEITPNIENNKLYYKVVI